MTTQRASGPVARVMRDAMGRREVTFYRLADETGFARSTLHAWASGKLVPRVTDAAKLADALGVDLYTLAGLTDQPAAAS